MVVSYTVFLAYSLMLSVAKLLSVGLFELFLIQFFLVSTSLTLRLAKLKA
ncbi:Uncharacterised protein [Streptococcus pneumoniae]|nr:Uncharacterised protein [Streptococcus pneumoniae]